MIGHKAATAAIMAAVGGLGILAVSLAADLAVERAGLRVFSIRTASVLAADYSSDPMAPLPPLSLGIIEEAAQDEATAKTTATPAAQPSRSPASTSTRRAGAPTQGSSPGVSATTAASAVASAKAGGTKAPAAATAATASETPRHA